MRKHVCGGLRDIPDNGWKNGSPDSKKQRSGRVRRFAVNNGGGVPHGSVPAVRVLSVATLYESDLIGRASVTEFRRLLLIWEDSLLHAHGMYGRALPSLKMESQKGSGYTSTSGQLEAIADNSRSTALQSSGLSGRGMRISSPYVLPLDSHREGTL